jgi:hypothetical protein
MMALSSSKEIRNQTKHGKQKDEKDVWLLNVFMDSREKCEELVVDGDEVGGGGSDVSLITDLLEV